MKIQRLILLAVIPMLSLTVSAQDKKACCAKDFTPKKGDFTLALTLGYNSYTDIKAPSGLESSYEVKALSTNWSDKKLMVGFEAGWFFKDLWKLNLGGGFNFTGNPGYASVPGTIDDESTYDPMENMGQIPNYRAVGSAQTMNFNVSAGVDRYFKTKVPNLMLYSGLRVGMAYCNNQVKYDEYESLGKSVGEAWNLRGAVTMGFDYFVMPGMYVGAQIDPLAYTYNMTTIKPQEGLSNLDADSHNFGFLAAPTVKVGFKFGKSNKKQLQALAEMRKQMATPRVEIREVVRVDTVEVVKEVAPQKTVRGMTANVLFGLNKTAVAKDQMPGVEAIANYLKKYPEAKATVAGYSDKATGTAAINERLANQRAQSVVKVLKEQYEIDESRLQVTAWGDAEQPFSNNDWTRVVIMIAE